MFCAPVFNQPLDLRRIYMRFLFLLMLLTSSLAHAGLKVGDSAPNELGKDGNGRPILVTHFQGKVLVVTFWASWCGYCLKELPALNALQNAIGTEYVQVIAINQQEDSRTALGIMKQLKDRQLVSSLDRQGKISESFGVLSLRSRAHV